jgi:hypothetical protein
MALVSFANSDCGFGCWCLRFGINSTDPMPRETPAQKDKEFLPETSGGR